MQRNKRGVSLEEEQAAQASSQFLDRISVAAVTVVNEWPCCVFVELGQPPSRSPCPWHKRQIADARRLQSDANATHSGIRTPTRVFDEGGFGARVYFNLQASRYGASGT
ncbi:hypothetical protein V7S43_008576 [Phytophthora oleae]|uniref:Uncharacterized protein n=1 Tax=Phytophthora oleae TaxID=2107226 RepID=A0ABD3FL82_9STRA